ncbi:uncharacterized protein C1orf127 homolog isoform X1 [Embiotoca jacksoni]|uniref:uncharacterized protein C1orf127 homolog isoform X1 n=1 Tax=Embiotoca jacksoni TaxID=100190 RepID=UPI003703A709
MGLTRRGSHYNDPLTVSDVSVNQTDNFTVHETSDFLTLSIPTTQILQSKPCTDGKQLLQPFYRVDVVLTFRETNHKMHWTMENTLPCIVGPRDKSSYTTSSPGTNVTGLSTLNFRHEEVTTEEPFTVPAGKLNERDPFKEETTGFSTTDPPYTQTQGSSYNFHIDEILKSQSENASLWFHNDTIITINSTETSTNTSAVPDFPDSEDTAAASGTSFTTPVLTEQEYPEFNTTSENEDQKKQRRPKWIWKDKEI